MSIIDDAKDFLTLAANGRVQEAYDRYVSPEMVHHNQHFEGDCETLRKAMAQAHEEQPNTGFTIRHVYRDKDTVITFSKVEKAEINITAAHVMRFETGMIVELWDINEIIDPKTPNENGIL